MINKRNILLMFLIAILIISSFTITFAIYKNEINVTYVATTGSMICDVEIVQDASYVINGIPYFLVKVRNYTGTDPDQTITAANLEYSLTIKNVDDSGSTGIFIWQKEGTSDYISTYTDTAVTNTYTMGTTAQEDVYKVFVKTEAAGGSEDVNVEVVLNAIQTKND